MPSESSQQQAPSLHRPRTKNPASIPIPGWKEFTAGSLAGMAQVAVSHPMDTIKVRLQVESAGRFKGAIDCAVKTIRDEGVLGLYKGMAAPLIGIGFVNAVLFSAFGWFKAVLHDPSSSSSKSSSSKSSDRQIPIRLVALAGAGAGIVNSFICSPVELVKIRLQSNYGAINHHQHPATPGDVVRALVREHGVLRGLFHGTWSTILREIPAYAGFYAGFEYAKRTLAPPVPPGREPQPLPVSRLMIAGSCGGIMYWTCCYPLDVAKTRIQRATPGTATTSVLPTLIQIYKEAGFGGWFRGFGTTIVRTIPSAAATFTIYELCIRAMG